MKFGMCIGCVDSRDDFVERVRHIETLGFDYLWLSDMGLAAHDVFAYLAIAAVNTRRIRLGACVHHPYVRHAIVSLNACNTINELSNGRAIFGIGTGGGDIVGVFGFKSARVAAMREILLVSRRLLHGETVTSTVAPVQLSEARLQMLKRPLPIFAAASGPRTLALAAELADGVFAHVGACRETLELALAACEEGRSRRSAGLEALDLSVFVHTCVAGSREEAYLACRRGAITVVTRTRAYADIVGLAPQATDALALAPEQSANLMSAELIDKLTLSGTVKDCHRKIEQFIDCGVGHITMFPVGRNIAAVIDTLGRDVLPAYR